MRSGSKTPKSAKSGNGKGFGKQKILLSLSGNKRRKKDATSVAEDFDDENKENKDRRNNNETTKMAGAKKTSMEPEGKVVTKMAPSVSQSPAAKKEAREVEPDPKEKERLKEEKLKKDEERRQKRKDLLKNLVKPGQIVEDNQDPKNKFEMVEELGLGGFGVVYLVKNIAKSDAPQYAMKMEPNGEKNEMETLKYEANIMVMLEDLEPHHKSHFVKCISRGQELKFKFVVMELLGMSIYDIRRVKLNADFTLSTALRIAIQTCEAIRDFHMGGVLHRDVKCQNFAVGRFNEEIVYIFDFGIAKRFMELRDDRVRQIKYRERGRFVGTLKYCSRAAHDRVEQAPKDDIECWLYMCLDLIKFGLLTWHKSKAAEDVINAKKDLFSHRPKEVFGQVPTMWEAITLYIDTLDYYDTPNYRLILNLVELSAKEKNVDLSEKLDWMTDNGNQKKDHTTIMKDAECCEGDAQQDENDKKEDSRDEDLKKEPSLKNRGKQPSVQQNVVDQKDKHEDQKFPGSNIHGSKENDKVANGRQIHTPPAKPPKPSTKAKSATRG